MIADLQARLFRAVQRNDLAEAKRLNDRIEPIARAEIMRIREALIEAGLLDKNARGAA